MKNKYSKKQLEELYNCTIFKDTGFDSDLKFWVAHGLHSQKMAKTSCLLMPMDGIWMSYTKILEQKLEKM